VYLLQVRFALSSSPVFSRTDLVTDSERFYNSVLDLFEDIEERAEVDELITWWNRSVAFAVIWLSPLRSLPHSQIFPAYSSAKPTLSKNSPLARIKEKRLQLRAADGRHPLRSVANPA
jgi:hypothetical protein